MRQGNILLLLSLALWAAGCSSSKNISCAPTLYTVYFHDINLRPKENIQHIQFNLTNGKVVAVNHFLPDWDTDVDWDNPKLQYVIVEARHFVDGMTNIHELDGFITISASTNFNINAILATESTHSTNGQRDITLARDELIIKEK